MIRNSFVSDLCSIQACLKTVRIFAEGIFQIMAITIKTELRISGFYASQADIISSCVINSDIPVQIANFG